MKVAIIHYWLFHMRGGEKVVEALCELFPQADIYTHVYDPAGLSSTINGHTVRTTFIQRLPFARTKYQRYLSLMPLALEELDLAGYDLVISSEAGPAKGVIVPPDALHICYCHTPMRYLWDQYHQYKSSAGWLTRLVMPMLIHRLRQWDVTSAMRVDRFIANSNHVARRIEKYYRRDADVLHPPVAVGDFQPAAESDIEDYYLLAGQLVFYKRPDIAIEAFNRLGKRLVVIGDGKERRSLERMAGPTIEFLGRRPIDDLRHYFARCQALVFPGEEDFGIIPVEVMASGRPVIAYGRGGALETVIDGRTGILFEEQTIDGLTGAIARYELERSSFVSEDIQAHAAQFDRDRFKSKFCNLLRSYGVETLIENPSDVMHLRSG